VRKKIRTHIGSLQQSKILRATLLSPSATQIGLGRSRVPPLQEKIQGQPEQKTNLLQPGLLGKRSQENMARGLHNGTQKHAASWAAR